MTKTILMKSKKDIVKRVADNIGISKKTAAAAVDEVFAEISKSLVNGEGVRISGFGRFEVRTRFARSGVNPSTMIKTEYPESRFVKFKPSKSFRDAIG